MGERLVKDGGSKLGFIFFRKLLMFCVKQLQLYCHALNATDKRHSFCVRGMILLLSSLSSEILQFPLLPLVNFLYLLPLLIISLSHSPSQKFQTLPILLPFRTNYKFDSFNLTSLQHCEKPGLTKYITRNFSV